MKYQEYKGKWWTKEKDENKIHGTLKFYPNERLELELDGVLENPSIGEFSQHDIILGETFSDDKITLNKTKETHREGDSKSKYYVNMAIIGDHIREGEDIIFKKISIGLNNLKEWLNISGINFEHDEEGFSYTYSRPKDITYTLQDELELKFAFRCLDEIKGMGPSQVNLKEESSIEIKKFTDKTLADYFEIIEMIKTFLSISVQSPIYLTKLTGILEDQERQCRILLKDIRDEKNLENKHKIKMPLVYQKLSKNFSKNLENLYNSYSKFENIYNLYHGIIYNNNMYPRQEFLFLINALESYHRIDFEDRYMDDENYDDKVYCNLVEAIPEDIPNSLKDSLKSRLKYHNEYSLKKRLDEILERFESAIDVIIEEKDNFSNRVKDMRNYYSHYFEIGEEITFEELNNKKEKLKTIVEICILGEIDDDLVKDKDLIEKLDKCKMKFETL